jgi:hypothetical protein
MIIADFFQHHPVMAGLITFPLAVLAGVLDLLVLKNRATAIVFWVFGFFPVAMPIYGADSLGGLRWFFGTAITILYAIVVIVAYRVFEPEKPEATAEDDETERDS